MTTTTMTVTKATTAGQGLSAAVRSARALVSQASDEIMRDLMAVEAQRMIEAAMTDEIKALILAAGRMGHYEMITGDKVPIVTPEAIISVCVSAYLRGLSLSGSQFAVWPKRDLSASLYIKSEGYRHLLSSSGRAVNLSVQIGYPEFRPLEPLGATKEGRDPARTSGKAVALMAGAASVVWDGALVSVEASGDYRIGIPCYSTDNIDGLQAKAERRLLMKLWVKCSGETQTDPEVSESVDPPSYIAMDEPAEDSLLEAYREEWKHLSSDRAKTIYTAVMQSQSISELYQAEQMDRSGVAAKDSLAIGRVVDWKRRFIIGTSAVAESKGTI